MNAIAWIIVACEIAFWVVIALGLTARYILRYEKFGLFLLFLTPVIDLILLTVTGIDMYRGATATVAHALAAVYIGVSIAFGKSMIQWADERFRYYIAKTGTKPLKRHGLDHARHYLKGFIRHVLAFVIGFGLLALLVYTINDSSRTKALMDVPRVWSFIVGIDFLITMSYFIWLKKETK